jgi:hypothetical protein
VSCGNSLRKPVNNSCDDQTQLRVEALNWFVFTKYEKVSCGFASLRPEAGAFDLPDKTASSSCRTPFGGPIEMQSRAHLCLLI